ncbi:hypothetical protein [Natronorubrum sp. A-ect3]
MATAEERSAGSNLAAGSLDVDVVAVVVTVVVNDRQVDLENAVVV